MIKQKIGLIILVLLFALPIVLADNPPLIVEIEDTVNEAEPSGIAKYKITVTNLETERDVFKISFNEFSVYPFSDYASRILIEPNQLKLDPEETSSATISIRLLDSAPQNRNFITPITVQSLIKPEVKLTKELKTFVISAKNIVKITPTVRAPFASWLLFLSSSDFL